MRASETVARLSPQERSEMARTLEAKHDGARAIVSSMRSDRLIDIVRTVCNNPTLLWDVARITANPFEDTHGSELEDPQALERIGLISRAHGGGYVPNIDMALTLTRHMPFERGHATTLLARLPKTDLAVAAKAMGVGPRPSIVDTILDTARAMMREDSVNRHVAFLGTAERDIVQQALERGGLELNEALATTSCRPPKVRLHDSAAGRRGLVLLIEQYRAGAKPRPLVPSELGEMVARAIDQVAPPPDVVEAKPRRRSPRASPTARSKRPSESASRSTHGAPSTPAQGSVATSSQASRSTSALGYSPSESSSGFQTERRRASSSYGEAGPDRAATDGAFPPTEPKRRQSASSSGLGHPHGRRGAGSPYRLGLVTEIVPAAALVDLESSRVAQDAIADDELSADVLEIVSESIVVLRQGVDPLAWSERCAHKLGL